MTKNIPRIQIFQYTKIHANRLINKKSPHVDQRHLTAVAKFQISYNQQEKIAKRIQ